MLHNYRTINLHFASLLRRVQNLHSLFIIIYHFHTDFMQYNHARLQPKQFNRKWTSVSLYDYQHNNLANNKLPI
jgi:hypothetical protein